LSAGVHGDLMRAGWGKPGQVIRDGDLYHRLRDGVGKADTRLVWGGGKNLALKRAYFRLSTRVLATGRMAL